MSIALPSPPPRQQGDFFGNPSRRFRLYRADHLTFDSLPSRADGGPAMVAVDGWCATLWRATAQGPVTLFAYRGFPATRTHALHGSTFPTERDAERAAFEAGLVAFKVYEADAARFGLPADRTARA